MQHGLGVILVVLGTVGPICDMHVEILAKTLLYSLVVLKNADHF